MNVALRCPMTLDVFLDREDRQPSRHEFDDFRPIAMAGGTRAHAAIPVNLVIASSRLLGKPGQDIGNDLKIEVAGGIRYPDGFVTCTAGWLRDKIARDPAVIFEVLSESATGIDTVVKNLEYAATPSVRRHVLLAQDVVGGTMFERIGDDCVGHVLGPEIVLSVPEIDVEVPIAEFYEGIDLPPPPTHDEGPA